VTGTAIPIPGVAGVVTLTFTCIPGPGRGADTQLRNNAQIAVSNGLRTVQNYQEW
jgi:hypothetical protein